MFFSVETGLDYEHHHDNIAQPELLSEETPSQNKVAFGLEYTTRQMTSPSNNI